MNTIPCMFVLSMHYQIQAFVFSDSMYGFPCSVLVTGISQNCAGVHVHGIVEF